MRISAILLVLLLAGCATTKREAAEARGYERGYAQAVKEQYWILQRQQRPAEPALTPCHP
jgi:hypothetical protein